MSIIQSTGLTSQWIDRYFFSGAYKHWIEYTNQLVVLIFNFISYSFWLLFNSNEYFFKRKYNKTVSSQRGVSDFIQLPSIYFLNSISIDSVHLTSVSFHWYFIGICIIHAWCIVTFYCKDIISYSASVSMQ